MHIAEKTNMKKHLMLIILSLLTVGCRNQTEPFERFEISYKDGWTYNYSILVQNDGNFIFDKSFKNTLKGKLTIEDLNTLKYELCQIEKLNLKSDTLDCIDCVQISLKVERKGVSYRVIQKSRKDSLLIHFTSLIDKMVKNKNAQISDKHFNFETYTDINPQAKFKRVYDKE